MNDYEKVSTEDADLKQRIAWFERMMFERESQQSIPVDLEQEQSVRQLIEAQERKASKKKGPGHNGHVPIPADHPRVEEVIEPEEDVSGMKRIGEDVTEVLEYEAGRVWVRRIVRPKYTSLEDSENPHFCSHKL